jgi:hypothetical protein
MSDSPSHGPDHGLVLQAIQALRIFLEDLPILLREDDDSEPVAVFADRELHIMVLAHWLSTLVTGQALCGEELSLNCKLTLHTILAEQIGRVGAPAPELIDMTVQLTNEVSRAVRKVEGH